MNTYNLHFIGRDLYSIQHFVEESRRIGVNRAIPSLILKQLTWGEPVLVAQYIPDTTPKSSFDLPKRDKVRAEIFGYFVVDGINMSCDSQLKQEIIDNLNVVESLDVNQNVRRRCGSYMISTSHQVTNTVAEIVNLGESLAKERGMKIKWFVAGRFFEFKEVSVITDIPFSRSLVKVEFNINIKLTEMVQNKVSFFGNYQQRQYIKKGEEI